MDLVIAFLLLVIVGLVGVYLFELITSSRAFRIRSVVSAQSKKKMKALREIEEKIDSYEKFKTDDTRIIEIISRIKQGKEVEIPVVAFDYIYRNINKISMIDKSGNLTIINQEEFIKFKENAMNLLVRGNTKKDESFSMKNNEVDYEQDDIQEMPRLFDIYEHIDGTIEHRNYDSSVIEIIKPEGKIYIQNNETNQLMIFDKEEEKENKDGQKHKKQISKDDEQKKAINIINDKLYSIDSKLANVLNSSRKNDDYEMEKPSNQENKETMKNDIAITSAELVKKEPTKAIENIANEFDDFWAKHEKKTKRNHVNKNKQEYAETNSTKTVENSEDLLQVFLQNESLKSLSVKEAESSYMSNISYINSEQIATDIAKEVKNFLRFLILVNRVDYNQYYLYDSNDMKLYIDINMLFYKTYCLVHDSDKEDFIKDIYGSTKSLGHNKDVVYEFLFNLNMKSSLALGTKPFYLNTDSEKYFVTKYLSYDVDGKIKYYQGKFIILNLGHENLRFFTQEPYFFKTANLSINELDYEIDKNYVKLSFEYLYNLK